MDIARGCKLLDDDISATLELSWAIGYQTAILWSSRSYTPPDPAELAEFDPADLLLVVDKNIKVVDDGTDAEIVRSVADDVATEIMDRLSRPWPEVFGRPGVVLEIGLVDGSLAWCSDGVPVCRLGDLGTLVAA